ncbi:alpha-factor-transporting ATPase [Leptotrichia wadei]|uniref:Alpha-factor-transporting ATPase n=1 Tax=Leptotrichia wadei TaxID=157687 RepID=A0A510KW49_9FUSO|nr:alpha-factor-transporting ATPase [Leptotrichia wadei]
MLLDLEIVNIFVLNNGINIFQNIKLFNYEEIQKVFYKKLSLKCEMYIKK